MISAHEKFGQLAMRQRTWWALGFTVLAMVAALAASAWLWLHRPLTLSREVVQVIIAPNTTPPDVAQAWVQAGVQTRVLWLYSWFKWSGRSQKIRAGTYEIGRGATPIELLEKMMRGNEQLVAVRFIEGWTFRQFRAELAKNQKLKQTTAGMSDTQIMQALGAENTLPEGRFHPDTYLIGQGGSDLAVLKQSYLAMTQQLQAAWQERPVTTPLRNPDEALILASIIEKETGAAADRGQVAGVFVNRLRLGMPLQTDPSVIYGLGAAFDGNLRKKDLLTDSPYNTYTRKGLPPTPIAMPGKAALRAALKPDATQALYFVSRGDGTSQFSQTLAEHNRAVAQYQLGGSKQKPQQAPKPSRAGSAN
jgi:UPF0755 protein